MGIKIRTTTDRQFSATILNSFKMENTSPHMPAPTLLSVICIAGGWIMNYMQHMTRDDVSFWLGTGLFAFGYINYGLRFIKWLKKRKETIKNKSIGNNPKT